jgi:RNA ligase
MLLSELLDLSKLQEHLNQGTVGVQQHPTLPLVIYNYTHRAQFTPRIFGDGVIDYCRGLIVHEESGEIIARPFKKFHNLNTADFPETNIDNIIARYSAKQMHTTEKMDGSLGIFWRYEDDWGIATRGSFTSPQAVWATNWYQNKILDKEATLFKAKEFTPLFEIVYPENRIVVRYDFEGLILLGLVNKRFGYEMDRQTLEIEGESHGFKNRLIVKDYGTAADIKKLSMNLPTDETNREGYVLSFDNNQETDPLKVKVKFEDYLRIHKMVTTLNPRVIWELMSQGIDLDIDTLPDHFKRWVGDWKRKLVEDYNDVFDAASRIYQARPAYEGMYGKDNRAERKFYAEYIQRMTQLPWVTAVFWMMYDKRSNEDINELVWDAVKPRGNDQSFRRDGE